MSNDEQSLQQMVVLSHFYKLSGMMVMIKFNV